MTAKDLIRATLAGSERIVTAYLSDLSDADLRVCPVEGMNPIAWQIGHIIVTENALVEVLRPGLSPALPEKFAAAHPRQPGEADPTQFRGPAEYLSLWKAQRVATLQALDSFGDAELDAPAPDRFQRVAGTVGEAINLMGLHPLMHAGQFVATRRKLNKAVAI